MRKIVGKNLFQSWIQIGSGPYAFVDGVPGRIRKTGSKIS